MNRFFLSLLLVFLLMNGYAQHSPSIHIVGEAKKMVLPDVAVFELKLEATEKSETESFKKLTDLSQEILKRLKADSFTEQQIKLTDFSVDRNEYILKTKEKRITYTSSQSLVVKIAVDKKRILNMYNHLTANQVNGLSISSSTECSDTLKDRIQKELIVKALNDAREKAELIAKTTGNKISSIEQIGYKTDFNTEDTKVEFARFSSPKIVKDEEIREDEKVTNSLSTLSYFTINEVEFNEVIKISYEMVSEN